MTLIKYDLKFGVCYLDVCRTGLNSQGVYIVFLRAKYWLQARGSNVQRAPSFCYSYN